jgi:hypothetical protein
MNYFDPNVVIKLMDELRDEGPQPQVNVIAQMDQVLAKYRQANINDISSGFLLAMISVLHSQKLDPTVRLELGRGLLFLASQFQKVRP